MDLIVRSTILIALAAGGAFGQEPRIAYPEARHDAQVDRYHGVEIADPFRWLEDDNSAETKSWVKAENKVTESFLSAIPERDGIRDRLRELYDYERFGVPMQRGGKYFLTRNTGLQNQSVLYVAEALDAEPRVLLDPNTLSQDGTVSLAGYAISDDGALMAYGLSRAGSDWNDWHVRDVNTGEDRADLVEWVKFSGASWAGDGSGFYYSRYDAPKEGAALTGTNEYQKLFFHRLGTAQAADALIYERPDHKDWGFSGDVTEDGRYLIVGIRQGTDTRNRVYYQELAGPRGAVIPLLDDFDASYEFIGNEGPVLYFLTDLEAPRSRVIAIDITKPARPNWREIVPQAGESLKSVNLVGGQFICTYLQDAHSVVRCYEIPKAEGGALDVLPALRAKRVREIGLPGLGSARGFGGRADDRETFYVFTSFTVPGTVYRLEIASGKSTVFREPHAAFDPAQFETRQVFYPGRDGTPIPMFITHRKNLAMDGTNPTLLYGYGGFDVSLTPAFRTDAVAWLEHGGIYAMANLRGGGEYGQEWHQAGIKERKQTVFDDFISAAEWLIAQRYTSSSKLAIQGGSNGGLLVGACMTQRPELFGAAIPEVGVLDMLRFHLFTIGWAWKSDYGSSEDAGEFKALLAYSPLHNLKPGVRYPATLITTADHDDRVVPAHSFKFAARLQECQAADGPPVLIRIESKAGHGAGTALSKTIERNADIHAFLTRVLGK